MNQYKTDMKTKVFIISILIFIVINQRIVADSPLTSTDFSKAYQNEEVVKKASLTRGRLTKELMGWLASENNPIAIKMAIINQLGWDFNGKHNSKLFFNYLKKTEGYSDTADFGINGNDYELLCMAYLKAMDNYFEVDEALALASGYTN